jgi:NAD(P)H-hydrate epimerase
LTLDRARSYRPFVAREVELAEVSPMRREKSVPPVPVRAPEAHKGDFGHVLVLAGSPRMTGAALLTTQGALRGGAGLVTLGMPAAIHSLIAPAMLCAMSLPLPSTRAGTFARSAIQPAIDFTVNVSAVAIGPGITTDDDTTFFATRVAARTRVPLVLDADGLNCLAKSPTALRSSEAPRILTPHPGEAARLLDCSTREVVEDREGSAAKLAQKFGAIVILKGRHSLVTDGERLFENPSGNPGMATGGAGDVLTGVVAALLAQGMAPFEAAALGAHVHGVAGDLGAEKLGQHALTAADILDHLGPAFLSLARD